MEKLKTALCCHSLEWVMTTDSIDTASKTSRDLSRSIFWMLLLSETVTFLRNKVLFLQQFQGMKIVRKFLSTDIQEGFWFSIVILIVSSGDLCGHSSLLILIAVLRLKSAQVKCCNRLFMHPPSENHYISSVERNVEHVGLETWLNTCFHQYIGICLVDFFCFSKLERNSSIRVR